METLPNELIAGIGAELMLRNRCRLFICCKYWRDTLYTADKDLFDWCRRNRGVISSISAIKHNIYNKEITELSIPGRTDVYYETISDAAPEWRGIYISVPNNTIALCSGINTVEIISAVDLYDCCRYTCSFARVKDRGNYWMIEILILLKDLLDRMSRFKLAIAFGRDIYIVYTLVHSA